MFYRSRDPAYECIFSYDARCFSRRSENTCLRKIEKCLFKFIVFELFDETTRCFSHSRKKPIPAELCVAPFVCAVAAATKGRKIRRTLREFDSLLGELEKTWTRTFRGWKAESYRNTRKKALFRRHIIPHTKTSFPYPPSPTVVKYFSAYFSQQIFNKVNDTHVVHDSSCTYIGL